MSKAVREFRNPCVDSCVHTIPDCCPVVTETHPAVPLDRYPRHRHPHPSRPMPSSMTPKLMHFRMLFQGAQLLLLEEIQAGMRLALQQLVRAWRLDFHEAQATHDCGDDQDGRCDPVALDDVARKDGKTSPGEGEAAVVVKTPAKELEVVGEQKNPSRMATSHRSGVLVII